MANLAVITGRLTADPEMRQTPDGTPVTSFSVAVQRPFKKDTTDFFDCVAWRKEAEFLCNYFNKGKWVEVIGSLQTRTYTDKSGGNRRVTEIVADRIGFVGDKPKDEESTGSAKLAAPPAPPKNVDPFSGATSAPPIGDYSDAPDDDGDLPF